MTKIEWTDEEREAACHVFESCAEELNNDPMRSNQVDPKGLVRQLDNGRLAEMSRLYHEMYTLLAEGNIIEQALAADAKQAVAKLIDKDLRRRQTPGGSDA